MRSRAQRIYRQMRNYNPANDMRQMAKIAIGGTIVAGTIGVIGSIFNRK